MVEKITSVAVSPAMLSPAGRQAGPMRREREGGSRTWAPRIGLALLLVTAPGVHAQDGSGVEVSGFVDVYYGYAFNKTDPTLRSFDVQHNAFSLSLAEVVLQKAATEDSRIGGRIDLDFGKAADLVAAFEPESNGQEIYKHIQQAYISMLAGDKVTIDVGKFVTIHGAEVIESQNNWNYTRSILFGYAIPFYHTGVRATIAASDRFSIIGLLVNGWNNTSDPNGDKTFGVETVVTPSDQLTWIANFMAGKEGDDDADVLSLFDTTLTLALTEQFSLMGNFDYGKQGDVKWWGLAAYAKVQPQENWAFAGRFEYVDDTEGGFMTIEQKAQSFTATSDHLIADDLVMRLEFRVDKTEDDFFAKDDGTLTGTQPSFTVGLVYGVD